MPPALPAWAFGVDIGGTNLRVAAVDSAGHLYDVVSEPIDARVDAEHPFRQVVELVRRVKQPPGGAGAQGVGIGVTGPIDPSTRQVTNRFTLPPGLRGDAVGAIGRALALPVVVENDAAAAARGEAIFGAGRGRQVVACITVGTGIGVGVCVDGWPVEGPRMHPEAGHLVIDPSGPPCYCGASGCVESLASGTAVQHTGVAAGAVAEGSTARDVHDAALHDPVAREIVIRAHRALGLFARNLVAMYAPDVVVLAGQALGAHEMVLEEVRNAVAGFPFGPPEGTDVAISLLGGMAGCVGAASFLLDISAAIPPPLWARPVDRSTNT